MTLRNALTSLARERVVIIRLGPWTADAYGNRTPGAETRITTSAVIDQSDARDRKRGRNLGPSGTKDEDKALMFTTVEVSPGDKVSARGREWTVTGIKHWPGHWEVDISSGTEDR